MYLNNFCSQLNGQKKLYGFKRSKIHLPIPEKLQYYAPSSICKVEDLYTINDKAMMQDFSINDEYDVEKKAFRIYENNYNKILKNLVGVKSDGKVKISLNEAEIFIKTLLNIKVRNPFYIFHPDKQETVDEVNSQFISNILNNYEEISKNLATEGATVNDLLLNIRKRTSSIEFAHNIQRVLMLRQGIGIIDEDGAFNKITSLLLSKKWFIYQTTSPNSYITSDNPGFTLMENSRDLMNVYFMGNFEFTFPLTPSEALVISSHFDDKIESDYKLITYEQATYGYVKKTNRHTIENVYKYA